MESDEGSEGATHLGRDTKVAIVQREDFSKIVSVPPNTQWGREIHKDKLKPVLCSWLDLVVTSSTR
jgi:hypothetical protein